MQRNEKWIEEVLNSAQGKQPTYRQDTYDLVVSKLKGSNVTSDRANGRIVMKAVAAAVVIILLNLGSLYHYRQQNTPDRSMYESLQTEYNSLGEN